MLYRVIEVLPSRSLWKMGDNLFHHEFSDWHSALTKYREIRQSKNHSEIYLVGKDGKSELFWPKLSDDVHYP